MVPLELVVPLELEDDAELSALPVLEAPLLDAPSELLAAPEVEGAPELEALEGTSNFFEGSKTSSQPVLAPTSAIQATSRLALCPRTRSLTATRPRRPPHPTARAD